MTTNDAPRLGHLRRVGWSAVSRGVYLPNAATSSLECRARAWGMVLPDTAVITHLSAAALRGWWLPRTPQELPFFIATPRDEPRPRRRGLNVVRHKDPPLTTRLRGLVITSPAETLLSCARDLGLLDLVVLLDCALHAGDCNVQDVIDVARQRRRGAPRLRQALRLADHRSESAGESLLRVLHVVCAVPVEPQRLIQDEEGYVVARADLRIVGTSSGPNRATPKPDGCT